MVSPAAVSRKAEGQVTEVPTTRGWTGSGWDQVSCPSWKIEQAAFELRRQGATFAIICHTLGLPYRRAKILGRAYDAQVGHPPDRLARRASQISLPGYTVRDGTRIGKGTTPETSERGKAH